MEAQSAEAAAARSARLSSSHQPALQAGTRRQQTQMHTQQTLQMLRWTAQLMMHKRRANQRCVFWLIVHALKMSWWHLLAMVMPCSFSCMPVDIPPRGTKAATYCDVYVQ